MQDGGRQWRLVVPAGGDALRQERLTRDLCAALHEAEGVAVGFADAGQPSEPGHKGTGVGEVALWAATATAIARPVSQVLITAIKEWCARDGHRKVEVTYDGHSVASESCELADRAAFWEPFTAPMLQDFFTRTLAFSLGKRERLGLSEFARRSGYVTAALPS